MAKLPGSRFATTHWTLIRSIGTAEPAGRWAVIEELAQLYWSPPYAYLRRSSELPDEAGDLVQGLFLKLVEGSSLESTEERNSLAAGEWTYRQGFREDWSDGSKIPFCHSSIAAAERSESPDQGWT